MSLRAILLVPPPFLSHILPPIPILLSDSDNLDHLRNRRNRRTSESSEPSAPANLEKYCSICDTYYPMDESKEAHEKKRSHKKRAKQSFAIHFVNETHHEAEENLTPVEQESLEKAIHEELSKLAFNLYERKVVPYEIGLKRLQKFNKQVESILERMKCEKNRTIASEIVDRKEENIKLDSTKKVQPITETIFDKNEISVKANQKLPTNNIKTNINESTNKNENVKAEQKLPTTTLTNNINGKTTENINKHETGNINTSETTNDWTKETEKLLEKVVKEQKRKGKTIKEVKVLRELESLTKSVLSKQIPLRYTLEFLQKCSTEIKPLLYPYL
ncbi:uncharacterized protein LOC115880352 [Sitophilus oryzae]|uniref:Uncharacterized protein LOC115880352 n=1 Tax=Sitophilus oryzae TaxID=7048 RepID=A0A6J2XRE7_SITOR|nr:uncharacterized protein LOC115880352 [Sitophilus oryzae]